METGHAETAPDIHADIITDVRFRSNSTLLATSSLDKTVKIWEASKPGYYCQGTMTGHTAPVMSLDFHPKRTKMLCSCDSSSIIHYWNIYTDSILHTLEGEEGCKHVRFQPQDGNYLAAAIQEFVSILDVATHQLLFQLEGHDTNVLSVSWDTTGKYLASVTEDSVNMWALNTNNKICEFSSDGENKFHSCVFHPSIPQVLIIGGHKSLELWNWVENRAFSVAAHEGLTSALAHSPSRGITASGSYDESIKIWK